MDVARKELARQQKRDRAKFLERQREKEIEAEYKKMRDNAALFEKKERERAANRRQQAIEKADKEKEKQ